MDRYKIYKRFYLKFICEHSMSEFLTARESVIKPITLKIWFLHYIRGRKDVSTRHGAGWGQDEVGNEIWALCFTLF